MGTLKRFAHLLALTALASPAGATLEWTLGAGDNQSVYQEANWIDPATGVTAPTDSVNANTAVNQSLIVRAGGPGGGSGAGGNLLMGSGDLLVSGATLRMSKGQNAGINMGSSNKTLTIIDGKVLTQNVASGEVTMQGRSELTLYGPAPLTGTTIDLGSTDCFVYFLDRAPGDVDGDYLDKFTVQGAPAVLNTNVVVTAYYDGAVIRSKPAGNIAVRAFDLPDMEGARWSFTPGFKGLIGLGLTEHDAGTYRIAGWGNDIWSTADQAHFAYRTITGDGEIVVRADAIANTNTWAKGGPMIRESLDAASRNAFVFQRPDGQVYSQFRTATDGSTSSTGGATADWLRLTRVGNAFTTFHSTTGANGPWTEIESRTLAMPATAYFGIAATSHIGVERGNNTFSQLTLKDGGTTLAANQDFGVFTDTHEIDSPWPRDDQTSSLLIKKGYMCTVAEHAGGQGFSQVYAATEADLLVNLPPELDNKVSFMRIVPWRWIAKRGWAGGNLDHIDAIDAFWNYEWEPTGFSGINREFVPMIRGRNQDKEFRWEEVRVRGGQTHFLVFNEPENANQGDLTVDEAIALYPKAQQLGLRLGSPARTDNASGDNWLQEFMTKADAEGYRVDYMCVHNYAARTVTQLKNFLDGEYAKYNRPIWLTEFQRDVDVNDPDSAAHTAYLEEVVPMLEDLDYLERYAYYTFNTANPSNGHAWLFNGDLTPNDRGLAYLGDGSNPGYRNTGQGAWASASINLPGGVTIVQAGAEPTLEVTSSVAGDVEYFANGAPITSLESLLPGLQTITATVTTAFGETLTAPARQVLVTDFGPPTFSPTGITWSTIPGESYRLETSEDLSAWGLLVEIEATSFETSAAIPTLGTEAGRFYRVVWE